MLTEPLDTIGRRKRYRTATPKVERYFVSPSDRVMLKALYHYGPLPPEHLSRLAHDTKYGLKTTQQRLCIFYDGSLTQPPLVTRPHKYRSGENYYDSCVYELAPAGYEYVEQSHFVKHFDHAVHRLMGACIGVSIEIALDGTLLTFLSLHDVLSHKRNMKGNGLRTGDLEPDWLFATRSEKVRFYLCEWDRNTEQLTTAYDRETIEGKLTAYTRVFENRSYDDAWGIPNARLLFAVTKASRGNALIDLIQEKFPSLVDKVYFKVFPDFRADWRVPQVYEDVLDGWTRADGQPFSIKE